MKRFQYLKPATLEEALEALAEYPSGRARVIAGGTDLVPALRASTVDVDCLVDIQGLGLDEIRELDGELRIGALATFSAIAQNKLIRTRIPVLAQAAVEIGAVQTRNLATIGGNLCSAVPSLDSAPPLMVLEAKLFIVSKAGARMVPIEEFFLGPRLTVLRKDEILTEIRVPLKSNNFGASFIKFGRRKAMSLAIVNVAAGLMLNNQQEIIEARIALGAVAPTPILACKAQARLLGQKPAPELFAEVAQIAAGETAPITDLRASAEYRRHLSEVLVRRALAAAWQQANGGGGRGSA
ncbi:MAG: xanthine dehydrogenase family protein subunit M [Syntrophothermus sp.]|uniref:FAD binding domain-containing protein n=1 Tax=Syntrophothermus sp. TaxID=2736299 RepID=UPI00258016D3|nr:xanthine dehydrogenase family protein subunit M [Syntrophothermus sp.]NSW83589.1 xanthine dehydrogenase family protein subunit M [Syntrophothermus sp.]